MMWPLSVGFVFLRSRGSAACMQRIVPKKLVSKISRIIRSEVSATGTMSPYPALANTASRWPNSEMARSHSRVTSWSLSTLQATVKARRPSCRTWSATWSSRSCRRAARTVCMPACAQAIAVAAPIPELAPAMRMTLSLRSRATVRGECTWLGLGRHVAPWGRANRLYLPP